MIGCLQVEAEGDQSVNNGRDLKRGGKRGGNFKGDMNL